MSNQMCRDDLACILQFHKARYINFVRSTPTHTQPFFGEAAMTRTSIFLKLTEGCNGQERKAIWATTQTLRVANKGTKLTFVNG